MYHIALYGGPDLIFFLAANGLTLNKATENTTTQRSIDHPNGEL